jgi:hypothetical protein
MQDVITRFYNPHVVRGILRRFLSARAVGPATEASFDHAAAQQFELEHAKQTIRETYPNLLASWRQHLVRGERWHSADDRTPPRARRPLRIACIHPQSAFRRASRILP